MTRQQWGFVAQRTDAVAETAESEWRRLCNEGDPVGEAYMEYHYDIEALRLLLRWLARKREAMTPIITQELTDEVIDHLLVEAKKTRW